MTFTPQDLPIKDNGRYGTSVDFKNAPKCRCGNPSPLDKTLGVCRECFRIEAAFARWFGAPSERFVDGTKEPYVKPLEEGKT